MPKINADGQPSDVSVTAPTELVSAGGETWVVEPTAPEDVEVEDTTEEKEEKPAEEKKSASGRNNNTAAVKK